MSPLVLEPGKLLQANRGFLLVDEIGKLPLGTQNVLLQALQEGTVTPSKSRESFPAFVRGRLHLEPLRPRQHQRPALRPPDQPARRLQRASRGQPPHRRARPPGDRRWLRARDPARLPGVRVIEAWRLRMSDDNPDIGEVGSNRTLIDVGARTAAIAVARRALGARADDLRAGLLHAMRGRIRARSGDSFRQNENRVAEFTRPVSSPGPQAERRASTGAATSETSSRRTRPRPRAGRGGPSAQGRRGASGPTLGRRKAVVPEVPSVRPIMTQTANGPERPQAPVETAVNVFPTPRGVLALPCPRRTTTTPPRCSVVLPDCTAFADDVGSDDLLDARPSALVRALAEQGVEGARALVREEANRNRGAPRASRAPPRAAAPVGPLSGGTAIGTITIAALPRMIGP